MEEAEYHMNPLNHCTNNIRQVRDSTRRLLRLICLALDSIF